MQTKKKGKYGFMSVRNRILIFALLITLIPSFGMGWLLNNMMHATVIEKSEQKLRHTSNLIEREIALWFKERNYDLYVFSNSFVINDNYTRYLNSKKNDGGIAGGPVYIRAIETYLSSVKDQFEEYTRLVIMDPFGSVVVSSHSEMKDVALSLPADMDKQIEESKYIKGQVYFEEETGEPRMLIGTPLFSDQYEKHIGILAIEVKLNGIVNILQAALMSINWETEVYGSLLRLPDGTHFLSTTNPDTKAEPVKSAQQVLQLFDGLLSLEEFNNHEGEKVVGVLTPLSQLQWGLIVAENYGDVFARVTQTRDRNILIACFLGVWIGLAAYFFARQIIVPLKALTQGAQRVADGDLDVHLPIKKNDELGFATSVFNEMVEELKQSQTKLEQLATTDALTTLANRKQIMKILLKQFDYYQRYGTEFAILMIDIDHFKNINDTHGHLVGDAVLNEIGAIFKQTLRNVDSAGRYGGEEFLVIVAESGKEDALHVAERIRMAVKKNSFAGAELSLNITVSVGVAMISSQDENENSLVSRADEALYKAKSDGRDKVVYLADTMAAKSQKGKVISLPRTAEK